LPSAASRLRAITFSLADSASDFTRALVVLVTGFDTGSGLALPVFSVSVVFLAPAVSVVALFLGLL
jgi:membrane protein DedA with SNARE-associated domain